MHNVNSAAMEQPSADSLAGSQKAASQRLISRFTPALFEALKDCPDHLRAAREKSEGLQRRRGALQ